MSIFSSTHFFTRVAPGSEMPGVPASETNEIIKLLFKSPNILNKFFVSSKKIKKFVPFIKKNFSGRKIVICREMTKYYEEFIRFKIDEIDTINLDLKGELTVVISEKEINKKTSQTLDESDKRIISKMINKLSIKEIVNLISRDKKISKKIIYNYCIKIKNEK